MIKKINYILTTKQKISLIGLAALLFVGGLFDLIGVSLILPIVNIVMDPELINTNTWAIRIKGLLNINSDRTFIIFLIMTMIVVYILKNVYTITMYNVMYRMIWKYKEKLSIRLLECYMYQDYTFHLNRNVSCIQRSILTDVGQFFGFITDALNIFNQFIVCILLAVYLMVVDWLTTIGVLFLLGGAIILLYKKQGSIQEKRGRINREANAEMNKWILQSFNGIKEIKVLGREEFFLERCEYEYNKGMEANLKSNLASIMPKPMMEMLCVSGLLLIILFRLLMGGEISGFVSLLAVFAVAAFRMLPCFNSMSAYMATMMFEKDSVEAVYNDIKEMETFEKDKEQILVPKEKLKFEYEININHITYTYPNTQRKILKDVNLTIKKNQSVGFIGASGAGKSTLIDIILGVLPLKEGSIEVDGINICENMRGWHDMIGYIPQSIYLMDDTIRNNVAFGIDENDILDSQIWKALEEAQIAQFIRELPGGLDAEIGDRGVRISGGQRQRIGIARALYHNPEVLVFDEATSALDNETEAALMEAIEGLKGKRTMLIIAHRLQTIQNCDVVYEVKDGRVEKRDLYTL